MDIKESVQQQFGAVAENYATSAVHAGGPDLQALVDAMPSGKDAAVLDGGCGTGHTALAVAPHAGTVTAVDLTEAMLEQGRQLARERGIHHVVFQRGDVEALDFPDDSFDVVTSRYSAHHYPHPGRALSEFARVLKPGGAFLLVDVIAPDIPAHDTFMQSLELLRDPSHVRDHSLGQWLTMLGIAGFTAEVLGTWPLRLQFDTWLARMQTPPTLAAAITALVDGAPVGTR